MAASTCTESPGHRRFSSKSLFRGLFLMPTTLAITSCLITLILYVSSTSNFFFHTHNNASSLIPPFTQTRGFSFPFQFYNESQPSNCLGLSQNKDQFGDINDEGDQLLDAEAKAPAPSFMDHEFSSQDVTLSEAKDQLGVRDEGEILGVGAPVPSSEDDDELGSEAVTLSENKDQFDVSDEGESPVAEAPGPSSMDDELGSEAVTLSETKDQLGDELASEALTENKEQLGVSDEGDGDPAPSSMGDELSSEGSRILDEHDVYHDGELFLKNYGEMNRSLKIYVYPHNKTHPFANVLLPVNNEPGGNYASETCFKNSLMRSHFITKDPSKADLFFLPFSIAGLRNDKRVGVSGLSDFIRDYMTDVKNHYPYWNRTDGADHFYVACHSVGRLAMEKADEVKSNAIQVICSSSYFLLNYYAHKDVGLPQVWPRTGYPNIASSKRKTLAFFAGAMNSPVRQILYKAWKNDNEIFAHSGRLPTPYADQLLGSKFCLQVKGFEVNTARLADAMFYGCVPVIIADYYDLPWMDILNWKSFSVIVTISDIPNLKKILKRIGPEEYSLLQSNVLKTRKHFQWNHDPTDYDAFYMVMYELWLRRSSIRVPLDG